MNREESIEIALKAWSMTSKRTPFRGWFEDHAEWFEAFAKLVAAKEREACAKVCEGHDLWGPLAAKTIRARGEA